MSIKVAFQIIEPEEKGGYSFFIRMKDDAGIEDKQLFFFNERSIIKARHHLNEKVGVLGKSMMDSFLSSYNRDKTTGAPLAKYCGGQ